MIAAADELLTVREVSAYLRKSPSTIYRLTRRGQLPATKVGGTWRYSQRRLEEWLRLNQPAGLPVGEPATTGN